MEAQASRLRQQVQRALQLQQAGKLDQAQDLYRKVLRLQPTHFDALHMMGVAAMQAGRTEYAVDLISRAIRHNPNVPAAHGNLAQALMSESRVPEAVTSFKRQLALQPDHPTAHITLALALKDLERYEESLAACNQAIATRPSDAVAWDKRGAALRELGRLEESLHSHLKACELQPDLAVARLHAGMTRLLSGDLEQGWADYEWRTRPGGTVSIEDTGQPRWSGAESLAGSKILLRSEQGLGDTLQFCRYAHVLHQQGAQVILSVPRKLVSLLGTLGSEFTVVADDEPTPPHDFWSPLLSLPAALRTTLSKNPRQQPYLAGQPERIQHWRERLGTRGFKIGIAWQGSQLPIDIGRSFALSQLAPLAAIPGVRLISLQKNVGSEQLKAQPTGMRVEDLGPTLDAGADAFLDTAAIMANLDLVIASDSSIAHLAGAVGCRAWIALKHIPDWRWLLNRSDSPWYPSLTLYRQPKRGDWACVFDQMRTHLQQALETAPS